MHALTLLIAFFIFFLPVCRAQLTPIQKLVDFQEIAGVYNKRYAWLDWKKTAFAQDALALAPWLDRVSRSQSDLEFFGIVAEYVASLQDSHSGFGLNSNFVVSLRFEVDLYGGKPLVSAISAELRTAVPFAVGDEVVSIDGVPALELIERFRKLVGNGNTISSRRLGASLLTDRPQAYLAQASQVGETANVVVKRKSGEEVTASVRWIKSGIPYISTKVPDPTGTKLAAVNDPRVEKPWKAFLKSRDVYRIMNRRLGPLSSVPNSAPLFAMPDNFLIHAGEDDYDEVYTGTFRAGGYRIGYLRIPDMMISSYQLIDELTYLADTDGLILDLMNNPGGSACFALTVASALTTTPLQSPKERQRVTWTDIQEIANALDMARLYGGEEMEITTLERLLAAYIETYRAGRSLTPEMGICGQEAPIDPLKDRRGKVIGYKGPIMVLTDEMTASSAELLSAILQDNNRALFFGMRTNGAGGVVELAVAGAYSEMYGSVTRSQIIRSHTVSAPGVPAAPYLENIGVVPNIVEDFMTEENLRDSGKLFVGRFTQAMVDYIKSKQ